MTLETDVNRASASLPDVRLLALRRDVLLDLGERLPTADAQLDALIAEAVSEHDEEALVRLMFAALAKGRPVDARHLVGGAVLFEEPEQLAAVALRCTGDVAGALVAAARGSRLGLELEATALFLAGVWSQEHREPLPPELVPRARTLARSVHVNPLATLPLIALSSIADDEGLRSILAPFDDAVFQEMATALRDKVAGQRREPVLSALPQGNEGRTVASGYTVRRAVKRIGRNEPCPCGSGKKYKRCCYASDLKRLQRSSDVPGVTVDELRIAPEPYLTEARVLRMRPHELARLDPRKVPEDLLPLVTNHLVLYDEYEALAQLLETLGFRESLAGHWEDAIHSAAMRGDREIVRRLYALCPADRGDVEPDLAPGLRLLLAEDSEELLTALETEALDGLRDEQPSRLIDTAHGLLASPHPGLGVLVARGVLPVAHPFDAEVLLEALLETRDRLNLPPSDPIEHIVYERFAEHEPESIDPEPIAELRLGLEEKRRETRRLREEIAALQDALADRREVLAPAPPEAAPLAPAAPDEGKLTEMARRLGALKEELKERHRERNSLRHELSETRRRLQAALERGESPAPNEVTAHPERESLFVETEEPLHQPVRVPEFPARFHQALGAFPPRVGRAALELVGRLAGGDPAAFRGMKRLKRNRELCRQKVGGAHRLLFRLEPDTLEVVALIARRDLERTLRTL